MLLGSKHGGWGGNKKFRGCFLSWTMDVSYIQETKIVIGFEEDGGCWILIWRLVFAWFQARWMGRETKSLEDVFEVEDGCFLYSGEEDYNRI